MILFQGTYCLSIRFPASNDCFSNIIFLLIRTTCQLILFFSFLFPVCATHCSSILTIFNDSYFLPTYIHAPYIVSILFLSYNL